LPANAANTAVVVYKSRLSGGFFVGFETISASGGKILSITTAILLSFFATTLGYRLILPAWKFR